MGFEYGGGGLDEFTILAISTGATTDHYSELSGKDVPTCAAEGNVLQQQLLSLTTHCGEHTPPLLSAASLSQF